MAKRLSWVLATVVDGHACWLESVAPDYSVTWTRSLHLARRMSEREADIALLAIGKNDPAAYTARIETEVRSHA